MIMKKPIIACAFIVFLGLFIVKLDEIPPLWFDEGWTISVAKNWIDTGHYGRLLLNEPISARWIAHPIPVTGPIAISFKLFGFGIWQARLPGVMYSLGLLIVIYLISKIIFDNTSAKFTIFFLLFAPLPSLSLFWNGRQVLGEVPMMFYLSCGYLFFFIGLTKSKWYIFLAAIFWGIALTIKRQVIPFWIISIMIPLLLSIKLNNRSVSKLILMLILSSVLVTIAVFAIQNWLEQDLILYGQPMEGILSTSAFVTNINIRKASLLFGFIYGGPSIIGVVNVRKKLSKNCMNTSSNALYYLNVCLVTFIVCWFVWYVGLSIGWQRYLFPVVLFGSIYLGNFVKQYTIENNINNLILNASDFILLRNINKNNLYSVLVFIIIPIILSSTIQSNLQFISGSHNMLQEMANYINLETNEEDIIELYDSELLPFLNRSYHYPPDQIQVELNKRTFLQMKDVQINYDPLSIDPDYVLIGNYGELWGLYAPLIESGKIILIQEYPPYKLYKNITH